MVARNLRNLTKAKKYKKAIGECCDPNCNFGYGLETHHIIPLSKGGVDDYVNFIVLCAGCHHGKGRHGRYTETQIELMTYKFYVEIVKLGYNSDDGGEDFVKALNALSKET